MNLLEDGRLVPCDSCRATVLIFGAHVVCGVIQMHTNFTPVGVAWPTYTPHLIDCPVVQTEYHSGV